MPKSSQINQSGFKKTKAPIARQPTSATHNMFFLKILRTLLLLILALTGLVAIIQISAFFLLADNTKNLSAADLLIAFPGEKEREAAFWALAAQGLAPNLAIINSTAKRLKNKAEENQIDKSVNLLDGGKSRSTFEDAFVAAEIIRKNNFNSVILVTSSYHMPRALFLLKAHLLGLGMKVDVQYYPFIAEETKPLTARLGHHYNEMIKIWGSILEITANHLSGKLINDSPYMQSISEFAQDYLFYKSD